MYFYRTPILKQWKLCGMILRANGSIVDALKAVPTGAILVSFDEADQLDDGIITVCPD